MQTASSIYSKQHPKIRQILEQAGSPSKVLCVAIDYAKAQHVILFCNGFGDILKKPFPIENSPQGLQKLLDEVKSTCSHRSIQTKHVFFGGEDSPSYVQGFTQALSDKGFLVIRVNAWEAKKQRDNHQAATDELDVLAIAKTLLNKATYSDSDRSKVIQTLRELSRTRAHFVKRATGQKLQIHQYASRLFPRFLERKKSGITPFSDACLALLSERFSPEHIRRKRRESLIALLERHGHEEAQKAADQLKTLAAEVFSPSSEMVECWQIALQEHVRHYQSLEESVKALDKALACCLAKTPGAFLTSISGIGVVLAAGLLSELGEPGQWKRLRSLCSYSGIVPRVYQSGGPDKPAQITTVSRRCSHRAKNWVVQAASQIGLWGPEELMVQYQKLVANDQHADFIMGKRLLRICKDLMRRGAVYRPKALLLPDTPAAELSAYYRKLWDHLIQKWYRLIDCEELFKPEYPLGQWRQVTQKLYKLSLPLPKQKQRKAA